MLRSPDSSSTALHYQKELVGVHVKVIAVKESVRIRKWKEIGKELIWFQIGEVKMCNSKKSTCVCEK